MRVTIIVSDDGGNTYEGEAELVPAGKSKKRARPKPDPRLAPAARKTVNLSTPIRAFVKQHARRLSGPQKFALLVAYLSKGDDRKEVLLTEVEKNWNKMKALLGGKFNVAYTTRAKDSGWVDSPKRSVYKILPDWKGIFDV